MNDSKPYELSFPQLAHEYKTDLVHGISSTQAAARLQQYGPNQLPQEKQESWFFIFFRQFQNPLIYILFAAAAIIFFAGHQRDACIISGVLFFNALVGTIQEGRTRTILSSLYRFFNEYSVVIRDGKKILLAESELVPGDLIVLTQGERIPADARIIEAYNVHIDESMLTGESIGIPKNSSALPLETTVYEQTNMVFRGTYMLTGSGKAIVVATGAETQLGRIKKSVEAIDKEMPLKKELDSLAHWVLVFIVLTCLIMLFVGLAEGKTFKELLVMLTALFICVIPEGLPVVLTLVLATGAYRMAKKIYSLKKCTPLKL